jgi:hypothetical protein
MASFGVTRVMGDFSFGKCAAVVLELYRKGGNETVAKQIAREDLTKAAKKQIPASCKAEIDAWRPTLLDKGIWLDRNLGRS